MRVFDACMTQWRVGFGGPVGLDYTAVISVMEVHGITDTDRQDCLERVRILESEVLHQVS